MKASGSRYRVVKNSLALRAAKGTALEKLGDRLQGTTGIAYTGSDPVALAKVLVDFAKDHPALAVKVGVVSGDQLLDAAGVKTLSTMPGLPEMRARLLGLLQTPATQLVRLLAHAGDAARASDEGAPGQGTGQLGIPSGRGRLRIVIDERGRRKRWLTFRRSRTTSATSPCSRWRSS